MRKILPLLTMLFCFSALAQETYLLRMPDISQNHITFVYANDIWIADHDGSAVKRLTSFQGGEQDPHFSPDGQTIAFTGQYDGNVDVYTVPISGGAPQRMTFHPSADRVRGWSPDGKKILFTTGRAGVPNPDSQFWTIDESGGFPSPMPLTRIKDGQLSNDGTHLVYQKVQSWEDEFRNYKGGQNNPIRVLNMNTLEMAKLPWEGSNDQNPVYVGNDIFFLSDRDGINNIWKYSSNTLTQVTQFDLYDCKQLESGSGLLIFENGGQLYSLDPSLNNAPNKLSIKVDGDFPWARPNWKDVSSDVLTGNISPTGKRAVFSARGEIFTVPKENGTIRNLSNSSGAADRDPAWSPDGKWISWFSDASGEYKLHLSDQTGKEKKIIDLESPTFYYTPVWSPDSKYLGFTDADRNLWIVNIVTGVNTKIDNERFAHPQRNIYPEWSPDSKFLAYSKRLENEYNAIYIYEVGTGQSKPLTDGLSDCFGPAWDASGKYIYFLSSINYGMGVGWLDMSSIERPLRYNVFMAVLNNEEDSPLAPKSDDEEIDQGEEKNEDVSNSKKEENKDKDEESPEKDLDEIAISWNGMDQRILSLDIPASFYTACIAGEDGVLFLAETDLNTFSTKLHKYILEDQKLEGFADNIQYAQISHDRKNILIQQNGGWSIVGTKAKPAPGDGKLNTSGMRMWLDPQEESFQMFDEAVRYQRDFFYVENVHGLDLNWLREAYRPWVNHVRHRSDMNYVLDIISGETSVGHSFVRGGDYPDVDRVPVGLLGADIELENNRYRIKKIYTGENWNPNLQSPLSGPGIDAKEGDYIIAINGKEITAESNFYKYFDFTSGQQITLTLSSQPEELIGREQIVVPVRSEFSLRQHDWVESNRRMVDKLSNGQLAYVWLPNTGQGGYNNFNRYFFAQKHKKGAIIDERFNGGGFAADYIVDLLSRDLMGYFNNPVGDKLPQTSPAAALYGPKVMVINEMAGSGGDYLPYMFKKKKIGPIVGTKTWGGLVGIWDVPGLIDGGAITAPRGGFFDTDGKWAVENEGVTPDVVVEQEPKLRAEGRDPQLEKAVEVCLELLKTQGVELKSQPADPIRARQKK